MEAELARREERGRNKRIAFLLIGPEGSGKTEIANHLSAHFGLPKIRLSAIMREHADNDPSKLGQACRRMFKTRKYLPPKYTIQIVREALSMPDNQNGFVLDGGNRTMEETEALPLTMQELGMADTNLFIISLRVPLWLGFQRAKGRKRPDDTTRGILSRMGRFEDGLGQRASFMKRTWNFIQVDARPSIEEVSQSVIDRINNQLYE